MNKPDTEMLTEFMTKLEAFLLHNGEALDHLDVFNKFEDLIEDAASMLKHMKDIERDNNNDYPEESAPYLQSEFI